MPSVESARYQTHGEKKLNRKKKLQKKKKNKLQKKKKKKTWKKSFSFVEILFKGRVNFTFCLSLRFTFVGDGTARFLPSF